MKMHWEQTREIDVVKRSGSMHPAKLVGLIFALLGLGFLVMGCVFIAVSAGQLPQLASPEVWIGDTPDELALPMVGFVFAILGAIFAAVGGGLLLFCRRQRVLREELLRFGTRVPGTVTEIRIDRTYAVNNRHPLRVMVQAKHPTTDEVRVLRSAPVWDTTLNIGDAADVYFDPHDERKYVVLLPQDSEK